MARSRTHLGQNPAGIFREGGARGLNQAPALQGRREIAHLEDVTAREFIEQKMHLGGLLQQGRIIAPEPCKRPIVVVPEPHEVKQQVSPAPTSGDMSFTDSHRRCLRSTQS
jgi:hypothetical protein